jgi:mRNA-degrading endonuclease RelE of RelBE toxin-antitoxin system
MYIAVFDEEWPCFLNSPEFAMQERTAKKIAKILLHPQKRHLKKGARFFVGQIGQCRIVYRVFEESKEVKFYFIGSHKEYEKWYKQFF